MRFNDGVFGVIFILFAITEISYAQTFPQLYGQNYGPNLFPIIIGIGFIVCGVMLVARGFAERNTVPIVSIGDWANNPANLVNVCLLLTSFVFYILFSDQLGFIPTSILILTVLLYRFGSSAKSSLAVASVTTIVIHSIFSSVLLVPLPWGLLQAIAW